MAEGENTNASTQQQDGKGEAKTDAQNAADQKGAQGDGKSGVDQPGNAAADGKGGSGKGSGDSGVSGDGKGKVDAGADDGKGKAGSDGKQDQKPAVPEKYDLKLSDGSLLDTRTVDKVAAIARERGLSNEDAQAHLAAIETEAMTERNERVNSWNESLKTDKDFGGEHYGKSLASVQQYAGFLRKEYPEVLDVLERSGYTSHPAIARFLRDMGNRMTEDKHGKGGGTPKREKPPLEERLYGRTTPKSESKAA